MELIIVQLLLSSPKRICETTTMATRMSIPQWASAMIKSLEGTPLQGYLYVDFKSKGTIKDTIGLNMEYDSNFVATKAVTDRFVPSSDTITVTVRINDQAPNMDVVQDVMVAFLKWKGFVVRKTDFTDRNNYVHLNVEISVNPNVARVTELFLKINEFVINYNCDEPYAQMPTSKGTAPTGAAAAAAATPPPPPPRFQSTGAAAAATPTTPWVRVAAPTTSAAAAATSSAPMPPTASFPAKAKLQSMRAFLAGKKAERARLDADIEELLSKIEQMKAQANIMDGAIASFETTIQEQVRKAREEMMEMASYLDDIAPAPPAISPTPPAIAPTPSPVPSNWAQEIEDADKKE